MSKLFVWDFHGVLEKGNESAVMEISNMALEKSGHKERFTLDECVRMYGLKWHEYFRHLLPDEPAEVHFGLQQLAHDLQKSNEHIVKKNIAPSEHSHHVLKAIKEKGHTQILISNTTDTALKFFTDSVGITGYFDKTMAANNHSGKSAKNKKDILAEFMKGKDFSEIVIIGDSEGDMELKDVKGGKTYLYTHKGFIFRAKKADFKINDLREVLKEL